MITLTDANLAVENDTVILRRVSMAVTHGMRLLLLGPNGCGKTLLLRALAGRTPPQLPAGSRRAMRWLQLLLWEAQSSRTGLDAEDESPIDLVQRMSGGDAEDTAALLDEVGIDKWAARRPCSCLSSGERTLAALAGLACKPVSLLLLDEPTAFLGAAAIDEVAAALSPERWPGTLVFTSHSRRMCEALRPTHVAHLDGEGGIDLFERPPRDDDFVLAASRTAVLPPPAMPPAPSSDAAADETATGRADDAPDREVHKRQRIAQ